MTRARPRKRQPLAVRAVPESAQRIQAAIAYAARLANAKPEPLISGLIGGLLDTGEIVILPAHAPPASAEMIEVHANQRTHQANLRARALETIGREILATARPYATARDLCRWQAILGQDPFAGLSNTRDEDNPPL